MSESDDTGGGGRRQAKPSGKSPIERLAELRGEIASTRRDQAKPQQANELRDIAAEISAGVRRPQRPPISPHEEEEAFAQAMAQPEPEPPYIEGPPRQRRPEDLPEALRPPPPPPEPVYAPPPREPLPEAPRRPPPPRYTETAPFSAFEWMIAGRYLRSRKSGFVTLSTLFSFLGITFGVATLIVVTAVMTGFRENLVNQIVGIEGHVTISPQVGPFENFDIMAAAASNAPNVVSVSPVVEGQALASVGQAFTGAFIFGMRGADLARMVSDGQCAYGGGSGSLQGFDIIPDEGAVGVAVGDAFAQRFGLCPGDTFELTSPNMDGPMTPFSTQPLPRRRTYRVTYVYDTGYEHYDKRYIYMPLQEAQLYFNRFDAVDKLSVVIDQPDKIDQRLPAILDAAREFAPGGVMLHQTWRARNGAFVAALETERVMMFVVLTMIIIVASLNIVSSLVMLVKDKTRNIAILRTMGVTRGAVMRVFFICGSAIGVIGTLGGVALGVVICTNIDAIHDFTSSQLGIRFDPRIYGLARLPAVIKWDDLAATCAIALSLSFLATLFPAWRAARLDPVEALRYE